MSPLHEAQMSDDAIPVTCPKGGYQTTYSRSDGAPEDLSLYGRCPEITRRSWVLSGSTNDGGERRS
jgi:hypothetical protein